MAIINKDIELAKKIIDNSEYGVISMINTDMTPYAVTLSMVRIGEDIFFHTAKTGEKITAFEQNTNVCVNIVANTNLVAEHFTTDFESLMVKSKVEEVIDHETKIEVMRVICEKYAKSNMANFDKIIKASLHVTAIYKIAITDFSCKVHKVSR